MGVPLELAMIAHSQAALNDSKAGAKARNLAALQSLKLQVPTFFVATADTPIAAILTETKQVFGDDIVIIRSSAQVEDTGTSSMAGQFVSRVAMTVDDRATSLQVVLDDAQTKLGTKWQAKFAVIVQRYIMPDYAGVLFTRNPHHGIERVCSYVAGAGEQLVSGNQTGQQVTWVGTSKHHDLLPFLLSTEVKKQAAMIERHFNHPQDIEWCLKDGQWYWLQARPITTITTEQYQQYLRLEQHLPTGDYFFEQTEICEQLPTPNPFQFSFLQALYGAGGPVDQLYKRLGVQYQTQDVFKLFDGWLYVDKQRELQSFLPSYAYKQADRPTLRWDTNILRTLQNMWHLQWVSEQAGIWGQQPPEQWCKSVLSAAPANTLQAWWAQFQLDYQGVVHIGLLADKHEKKLRPHLKRLGCSLSDLIDLSLEDFKPSLPPEHTGWQGNGLDAMSVAAFNIVSSNRTGAIVLDEAQQHVFGGMVTELTRWITLKEVARWITVKHINNLKALLPPDDVSHFSFLELITGTTVALPAKPVAQLPPPTTLTNLSRVVRTGVQILSRGPLHGLGITLEQLATNTTRPCILIVNQLSPDLVEQFDNIDGILCTTGSQLSHLAIMAREHGIAVRVDLECFSLVGNLVDLD